MKIKPKAFESGTLSNQAYVYDYETWSKTIVDVPVVSLCCDESNLGPTSTTTTIGFLTRDPIGFEGGLDLYSYTANQPLRFSDPSGLWPHWWDNTWYCLQMQAWGQPCTVPPLTVDEVIDDATDIVCIALNVFDVVTIPSGEGPIASCGLRVVASKVKTCIANQGKKKAKDVLTCEFIYQSYKDAGYAATDCTGATTCADATAKAAQKATEVAMRGQYLGKRCDYILPGSIAAGSAKKEANHKIEFANATNRLVRCSAHAADVCKKECCTNP